MKKAIIFITIAVVAIAALLAFFFLKSANPKKDFENTMNSIISGETTKDSFILSISGGNVPSINSSGISKDVTSKVTYVTKDIKKTGDKSTATVEITYPDVQSIMNTALINNPKTEDELLSDMENTLKGAFQKKTETISVELDLINRHWYLVTNDEFSNAMSGGVTKMYKDLQVKAFDDFKKNAEGK